MDLLILIILTIIYCFVICFIVQSSANKCEGTIRRIKTFIPNCKENIIMFLLVCFMLLLCVVFLYVYYKNTLLDNIKLISILAVLCPAAYSDWNKHIIPNKLLLGALCLRILLFVFELVFNISNALQYGASELISAVVIFILGFLCSLIIKGSVGMGDVKLISIMALFLGASGIVCAVFASLLISFIYCLIALIARKKHKKDIIPFAPSLLLGTYISICLFGF